MSDDIVSWCRKTEAQMTNGEICAAFALMRAHGWNHGDCPPAWVWAQVYRTVLGSRAA